MCGLPVSDLISANNLPFVSISTRPGVRWTHTAARSTITLEWLPPLRELNVWLGVNALSRSIYMAGRSVCLRFSRRHMMQPVVRSLEMLVGGNHGRTVSTLVTMR